MSETFDYKNLPEDEESEELMKQINEFKAQNLTNNIDFEKAEQERLEIETKLKEKNKNLSGEHSVTEIENTF